MKHSYYTYYEGYNNRGEVIFNGNGYFTTEPESPTSNEFYEHIDYLLKISREQNPLITRIVIKNLAKL
ncbi:hypothetical protein KKJ13_20400 [Xenorhabdus bovienii]|uniref:hypothetical protein n=1 Tax=Xenorhabdus bovienii TaxID=40576 RepID=UPI0023B30163|nr:hypothetical protein [Xenorhabdus bovienii]MDE9443879.1 hypothetical protein [Xenorhabdus bovienii]